jgi:hypothetical protein
VDPTRLHYERSLALHRAVAERILADASVVDRARERLEAWIARGGRSAGLLARWRDILARPRHEIAAFLADPSEEAAWLRSASPFAGALHTRTRLAILRQVPRDR